MFCIPIIAPNTDEALKKIAEAAVQADVLELRLDLMESFDLSSMVETSKKPVIATYRTTREGGRGSDDPQTVGNILLRAIDAGAEFVDMELCLSDDWQKRILASKKDSKVIVSSHFLEGTPSSKKLNRVFQESVSVGGDVVKIISMAREWEDILRVLELIPTARKQGVQIIAFCMGNLGRISRVLSHLMGGYLTFTSLETGQESAPGQIPIKEMKALIKTFSHEDTKARRVS